MDNLLSDRAVVSRDNEDFLSKYIAVCNSDPYDEKKNPSGYINFGTAENNLCNDLVHPRIQDSWVCDVDLLRYEDDFGTLRLREVMAKYITEFFETHDPVSPNNLFCLTGVTSCIDVMAHCLADPGEFFLVPTPVYGCMTRDFLFRSGVKIWPVQVISQDDSDEHPELTLEKISCAYEEALAANCVIRGILLVNPNNPLGDVYSPKLLMDIISFCSGKSLHLIVDEIYALSVFSKTAKFHSVLKFPHLPDRDRIHVLYGLGKDFGLAGLRNGVIHTHCRPLQKCLIQLSALQTIPYPIMEITARFVEDLEWCRMYVNTYQDRLAERYKFCVNYLKKIGVKVRKSPGACFLWVDFRHLCGSSFEEERKLFNYLLDKAKLYVNPGQEFLCAQPGWFRFVFIQSYLKEGLQRLKAALAKYKPSPQQDSVRDAVALISSCNGENQQHSEAEKTHSLQKIE